MKKRFHGTSLLAAVLTLSCCLMYGGAAAPVAAAASTTYQASASFYDGLGIQGKDMWYAMQGTGTQYQPLTWDAAGQKWQGTQTFLSVDAFIMHPESDTDAVRKWVAPCDGTVRLNGTVRKHNTAGGDGVVAVIRHNDTAVWGPHHIVYNDGTGLFYDLTRTVKKGDALYFSVNKNGDIYYDSTHWDPSVSFTPLEAGTAVYSTSFEGGASGWQANWNTTVHTAGGLLQVAVTGADPSIVSPDNLAIDITRAGLLTINYKNSTGSAIGCVYFTTTEDGVFSQSKAKVFDIVPHDTAVREYRIDMSGVYGWIGTLKQLRLDLSEASSGSYAVASVALAAGGAATPAFSLMDREVIYDDNTLKNIKDLDYYSDSIFGVTRDANANYRFISSNGGAQQCTTISSGTLEDPARSLQGTRIPIAGVPSAYGYNCAGPVYQDPGDPNTLITMLHLERHYTIGGREYFDASLGMAVSRNNGQSWTWCGEIIDHEKAYDAAWAADMDIGAGAFLIQEENGIPYFYVYAIDIPLSNPHLRGLSVSRAPVAQVLAAAKNNTTVAWNKYYNGGWTEPGLGGRFTNLFHPYRQMNYFSISHNTYTGQYMLAYVSTDQWGPSNWSDISLLIAQSPLDFFNNTREILIDASVKYTQYPTIVGLGNGNPQTECGKNFYIYYTQWDDSRIWGSDTNIVRKMIVLD